MTVGPTSHLHHLPPAPPHSAPSVTMETQLAHTLPLLLPKPRPHKPCASPLTLFIFSAVLFVYFVFGMYVQCVSGASVRAHSHHLGHKVSSVHGTWVLWFEGSFLWSAQWWPWSNRQNSREILIIFRGRLFWVTLHFSLQRSLSLHFSQRKGANNSYWYSLLKRTSTTGLDKNN